MSGFGAFAPRGVWWRRLGLSLRYLLRRLSAVTAMRPIGRCCAPLASRAPQKLLVVVRRGAGWWLE